MLQNTEYEQTLAYLYERLPMFSRIGKAALKPDLSNTLKLCQALGNPQDRLKCVHIAGTNGKGSTSHMIAAVLNQSGYKTGLYTSPHLVDFRERIRVDGQMVSQDWIVSFVAQYRQLIEDINPSFFEITVAMAFQAFVEHGVDIAVIETGLGGRLDSTNVILPLLSVITNISYDHKDLLGDTLPAIAAEKAGIIKPKVPILVGERHNETAQVFEQMSGNQGAQLLYADDLWQLKQVPSGDHLQHFEATQSSSGSKYFIATDLGGSYQLQNVTTVLAATDILRALGYNLTWDSICKGLAQVNTTTGFGGRWQLLRTQPITIADVAHNTAGMQYVLRQWARVRATTKHIVLGFVRDKDISEVLALFRQIEPGSALYFTNAQIPRALPAQELQAVAHSLGLTGACHTSVAEAIASADTAMKGTDALLITGSFFIVGEAISYIKGAQL
jgi:dihydrofolate synthase / folylpolyglutamate synthase